MRTSPLLLSTFLLVLSACGDTDTTAAPSVESRLERLFPADPPFGAVNRDQVRQMLEVPEAEDGPFYLVNLIQHRERAVYPDGRETNLSGAEADALYGTQVLPILLDIGARPVFVADVGLNLINPDGTPWTQVGVVLYPSRAKLFEMIEREDFQEIAIHKQAGVEKTIVLVGRVEGPGFPDEFRQLDLTTVPTPPTAEDPPISVIHLLGFHETAQYADGRETNLSGREAMQLYEQGRSDQGVTELGVRPGLWLTIEGEFIGDGRTWDEFRINNFPNRTTFFQIASRDSLQEAGIEHREAAIQDTYTLLTEPVLTEVGYD